MGDDPPGNVEEPVAQALRRLGGLPHPVRAPARASRTFARCSSSRQEMRRQAVDSLRGHRPEEHLLVTQRAEVAGGIAAVGQHDPEVAQDLSRLVPSPGGCAGRRGPP